MILKYNKEQGLLNAIIAFPLNGDATHLHTWLGLRQGKPVKCSQIVPNLPYRKLMDKAFPVCGPLDPRDWVLSPHNFEIEAPDDWQDTEEIMGVFNSSGEIKILPGLRFEKVTPNGVLLSSFGDLELDCSPAVKTNVSVGNSLRPVARIIQQSDGLFIQENGDLIPLPDKRALVQKLTVISQRHRADEKFFDKRIAYIKRFVEEM